MCTTYDKTHVGYKNRIKASLFAIVTSGSRGLEIILSAEDRAFNHSYETAGFKKWMNVSLIRYLSDNYEWNKPKCADVLLFMSDEWSIIWLLIDFQFALSLLFAARATVESTLRKTKSWRIFIIVMSNWITLYLSHSLSVCLTFNASDTFAVQWWHNHQSCRIRPTELLPT